MSILRLGQVSGAPDSVSLASMHTGNGYSANIADRLGSLGPSMLAIVSDIGSTPTVTVAIQGSHDGNDWWSIPYCETATPETIAVATFAITTATTTRKILRPNHPWRFCRLNFTLNTNVTIIAADLWIWPG